MCKICLMTVSRQEKEDSRKRVIDYYTLSCKQWGVI